MSEEIKEILDYLSRVEKDGWDNIVEDQAKLLTQDEVKALLSHITILQDKIYFDNINYKAQLKEWKDIVDKASEYINNHLYMESTCGIQHPTFNGKPSYDFNCFDLLNILQGSEDNERL